MLIGRTTADMIGTEANAVREVDGASPGAYFVNTDASRNRCARALCERSSWLLYFAVRDSHATVRASVYKDAIPWIVDLRSDTDARVVTLRTRSIDALIRMARCAITALLE